MFKASKYNSAKQVIDDLIANGTVFYGMETPEAWMVDFENTGCDCCGPVNLFTNHPEHVATLREWIKDNCESVVTFPVMNNEFYGAHLVFDNQTDALMCYTRFK